MVRAALTAWQRRRRIRDGAYARPLCFSGAAMKRLSARRWLLILGMLLGGISLGGAATTIHVILDGADAGGAEVFVDAQLRGKTDAAGKLSVDSALLEKNKSVLTARLKVFEAPGFLPGHADAQSPNGWVMRTYVTSVVIDDTGTVHWDVVADKTAQQELVLRRDNVLIGLQVLVSVDWDMAPADFARLMENFQAASRYFWNATDGQFIFESVKIADQAQDWGRSEYRLWADNTIRPNASPGGYLVQNPYGALASSSINIPWRDPAIHLQDLEDWSWRDPRVFVHEFGHLGFSLKDEYSDFLPEQCTVRRSTQSAQAPFNVGGEKAACIMDSQTESNKFCSDQSPNPHNYTSQQPDDCWAGIRGGYSDPAGTRWILKTPVTRGMIVGALLGPKGMASDALPPEWNTNFVITNKGWPTALCMPFLQTVTDSSGVSVATSAVKLLYTSIDPSSNTWISEGKTLGGGTLAILGAHVGDTVMTETAYNPLTVCPNGIQPEGPLGLIDGDADRDHVLDPFDTCATTFNPYDNDPALWPAQKGAGCGCNKDDDCPKGLVCSSPGPFQCTVPACRSDEACGPGRQCVGKGAAAVCTEIPGTKRCRSDSDCVAGHCDRGDGSSRTGFCVANIQAGKPGDICSDNGQCASGNCSGLAPDGSGAWRPGICGASPTKALGEYCFGNSQCASNNCDLGDNTSKTHLCVPHNDGRPLDFCSHDDQCLSHNCGGLAPLPGGGWMPGTCSAAGVQKTLGDYCFSSGQCTTGLCDTGLGSSHTERCMPNTNGAFGQICSNDNQCTSRSCSGVSFGGQVGTCGSKKALGVACTANMQCISGSCDFGNNTSNTYLCMPLNDGPDGVLCSMDTQCQSLNCGGLTTNNVGAWVPGHCAVKRSLGTLCTGNNECGSTRCDAGIGTSRTNLCVPNGDGQSGQICSDDGQCLSQVCAGLKKDGAGNWVPGQCADKQSLGSACSANYQCASTRCDAGIGTSQTNLCVPNGTGQIGQICSDDAQCLLHVCAGLRKDASGRWMPGSCAAKKALGDGCMQNYQCGSGYCDSGNNTSRTDRCMPNTNGVPGDICSHDNQCSSRKCLGLRAQGNQWIPGTCQ